MRRRSRYQVIDPRTGVTLQMLTLYGDSDDDTRKALYTMLSESIAITHGAGVLVRHSMVDLPECP